MSAYQLPKQLNAPARTFVAPAAPWSVNDIIKLIVVSTMCLALLGVIYMALVGLVEPMIVVSFVLTTLTGIIAGAGIGYMNKSNVADAKQDGFNLGIQTQRTAYQTELASLATRSNVSPAKNP